MARHGHVTHLHPRALSTSSCSLCSSTALSLASCTDSGDDLCSCSTTAYGYYLSSCMASQQSLGCVPSNWASASSSISASCSYWSESLGSVFCGKCTSTAIATVGCADYNDYPCLCAATGYTTAFSTCAAGTYSFGAKCPFKTSASIMTSYASSCSSYSSSISAFPPGCPSCQAAAADQVSCSGRFDYKCICSRSTYVMALSSCIASGRCSDSDFSIARNSYTDACSVVATGGTPTTAAAMHSTGKSGSGKDFPSQTGDAGSGSGTHGPKVGVIAAVTGGVVFLIAALVIGGFFLFRRRRDRAPAPVAADSVPLQPTNNNPSPPPDYKASSYPQEADGVAIPGHPGYTPPPLPPGHYEAPANDTAGPSPAWQAQGYMVSDYNKPARGAYVELGGDAHVPPPTPPQQYPPYQYQQQQPYQRPLPGGGGNGPVFELGGPGR